MAAFLLPPPFLSRRIVPRFWRPPALFGPLLLVLWAAAGAASARPAGTPSARGAGADPIREALVGGEGRGQQARLDLEILEITAGRGMKTLGRFVAPLDPARPARLRRRFPLPPPSPGDLSPPTSVDLDVRIRCRWLSQTRLWLDIDSSASLSGSSASAARRRTGDALASGRSALAEIFQVPGTRRRLALAAAWRPAEGGAPPPAAPAGSGPTASTPERMVDLLVELVRVEKGREQTLRRQALKAVLGAEARSLLQLVQRQPGGSDLQHLEVRLTPRAAEGEALLMEVAVKGRLDAEPDAPPLLVDHRDDFRLDSGRGYSLTLGGAPGEGTGYRLDITPRLEALSKSMDRHNCCND